MGIKQVEMTVVTLCDTLRFVLIGETVNPPTENLVEQIDFGKVEVTTRKDSTVAQTIRNVTNAPLNITNTRILGPDTLQFSIVSGGGAFTLAPGESRVITLRFAPTRIARTSARLAFFHAFLGSPATILLAGEGIGIPRISASPKDVSLTSPICSSIVPIDTVIRIENIGTGVMWLDSAAFTGVDSSDFRVTTVLPDTVTRGGWKNIRIRYVPQMSGQRFATLRLFTSAANVPKGVLDIKVTGNRDTVVLFFPVQNLVLTNVRPFTSVDAFLNLSNRGTVPMTLPVPVSLGKFTVVAMTPNPIPPGGTARVLVNFNNGDTSATYDTLYTVRDSCGGLSSVRLRAYTMSPRPTIVILSSLDIAGEPCRPFTDTTLIITNAGMSPMTISDISIVGDTLKQYTIRYKPPQKLESNAVDSLVIRYTPTTTAKQNASLVIRSDAQNAVSGATVIPLNGTWNRTSFILDTDRVVLDNVPPNTAQTATVGLRNDGTVAIRWTLPITRGRSTITSITPNPTPVGATAVATVRITGAPSGSFSIDTLFVRDQCDKGRELRVQLQVQTTRPLVRIRTMPTVSMPCITELDTFIIIDNAGLDTLRIDSVTVEQPSGVRISVLGFFPRRILTFRRDTVYFRIDASGAGSSSIRLTPRVSVYSNSERDSVFTQPFVLSIDKSDLRFATATFAFPKQKIYRSTTQTLGVTNTGMVPMRFVTPLVRGKFSIDSVSPNPLAAGGTGTMYLRFAGDTVGMYSETFRMLDMCDKTHTLSVTVEVAPVVPAHLQTVSGVDMTEQCYSAVDTTVLITNSGAEDLDISRIHLRGANADEFSILTDTAMVLAPDATHLVLVRHRSKGITGLRTAELVMVSNTDSMVNKETVVNLRLMKDSVDVSWEFAQLHLGIVDRNTRARGTVQVTNRGTLPQTVSVPLAGRFAVIDSIVPNPLLPGTTGVAYVSFNVPDSVGSIKETLTFMNPCSRGVPLEVAVQIRGNAEITTPDTTVMIGDVFTLPILLSDPSGVKLSGVEGIRIDLRWNVTMMQLLGVENGTVQTTGEDGAWRTCRIMTEPISGRDKAIAWLRLQAALGNDSSCVMEITDIYNSRGITDLAGRGGRVTIAGHCQDGGTRLMDRAAPTAVRAVYPNPAGDDVTLAFTTAERAPISVVLVDMLGRKQRTVFEGLPPADEWSLHVPLSDMPSGVYQFVLQTPTQRRAHRLEIHR
ncbi:MAG: choice-of-anchor D domain-containing protein [Candidatus Kapaibacterium sp.]